MKSKINMKSQLHDLGTRACFDGDRICAIGRCEPCQVGNQAALSRLLDVLQPIRSPSKQTRTASALIFMFLAFLCYNVFHFLIYQRMMIIMFRNHLKKFHKSKRRRSCIKHYIENGVQKHFPMFAGSSM